MERLFVSVLLAVACASALSAKTLMRQTGWQTCGGGRITADWEVWEVNANGTSVLKGWLYEKCDGTSIWTSALTSTHPLSSSDGGIEISTTPPPALTATQWASFRSIEPKAVQFAIEDNTLTEIELMDDSEPHDTKQQQGVQ